MAKKGRKKRKGKKLLTKGLPSILYFKAYSGPKSVKQIAREYYGAHPEKKSEEPVNMYDPKQRLMDQSPPWMIEQPNGVLSMAAPLVSEIEKKVELNEREKKVLTQVLPMDGFRKVIGMVDSNIEWKRITSEDGINAPNEILSTFDSLVSFAHTFLKIYGEESLSYEEFYKIIDNNEDIEEITEEVMQNITHNADIEQIPIKKTILLPIFLPSELAEKISGFTTLGKIFKSMPATLESMETIKENIEKYKE